jgi:hypothetical protein
MVLKILKHLRFIWNLEFENISASPKIPTVVKALGFWKKSLALVQKFPRFAENLRALQKTFALCRKPLRFIKNFRAS